MDAFSSIVNASATSLYVSLLSIVFNPTAWNIVAQNGRRIDYFPDLALTRVFMLQSTETRQSLEYLVVMLAMDVTSWLS